MMAGGTPRAKQTIKSLRPDGGPNWTNVLLFGEPGSGKSSFTATLAKSFDVSAVVPSVVPPGCNLGGSSHTRDAFFYRLADTNIRIRDVWGWRSGERNFEPMDFRIIMMGSAPNGVKEPSAEAPIAFEVSNKDYEIDAVVFFLNTVDYAAQPSKFVAAWRELLPYVTIVQELKKPYVFVINKLDELDLGGTMLVQRGVTTLSSLQLNNYWVGIASAVMGLMGSGATPPLPLVCYLSTELRLTGPSFRKLEDVEEYALNVLLSLLREDGTITIREFDMFKHERPHKIPISPGPEFWTEN